MSGIPSNRFDLTAVFTAAQYEAAGPRTLVDRPPMGQIVREPGSGKEYMFVENVDTVAREAGDVTYHSLANGVEYEVDQLGGANTGINLMAGVCMGAIPASGGRGWIQTYGYNDTVLIESTTDVAIGDSLKGSSGKDYVIQDQAIGTEASYARHIVALAAATANSAATAAGFILCR